MAIRVDRTILVIEDDVAVLGVLRIALARAGFTILEASTGSEALTIIGEQSPDGVILDLTLPDGKAGAVLDVLRSNDGSGPAWLAVSALERDEVLSRYGDLDSCFVPKPFDPWDLANRLKRVLRKPDG